MRLLSYMIFFICLTSFADTNPSAPCQKNHAQVTIASHLYCAQTLASALNMANIQLAQYRSQSRVPVFYRIVEEQVEPGELCILVEFFKCVKVTADLEVGKNATVSIQKTLLAHLQKNGWTIEHQDQDHEGFLHLILSSKNKGTYQLLLNKQGQIKTIEHISK